MSRLGKGVATEKLGPTRNLDRRENKSVGHSSKKEDAEKTSGTEGPLLLEHCCSTVETLSDVISKPSQAISGQGVYNNSVRTIH